MKKNQQIAYSIGRTEGGNALLVVGMPIEALRKMRADGSTQEIDLTMFGLPMKCIVFGAGSHQKCLERIDEINRGSGQTPKVAELTAETPTEAQA